MQYAIHPLDRSELKEEANGIQSRAEKNLLLIALTAESGKLTWVEKEA